MGSPFLPVQPVTIRAHGWAWRHSGRAAWAISELDLHIAAGEKVLLLGASGSGKSTLLHALAGVLGDDEGESKGQLLLDGRSPVAVRDRVGLLMQDPDSQVILARVGDDVAFGCENLGIDRQEIWRRANDSLDAVGLKVPLTHSTSELSGGQKQRLALAGVIAMHPGLLLLDEPTANLDESGVRDVRDAVARLVEHSEATFLVIEHRIDIWRHIVNRVIVLQPGGGVLVDGHPDVVFSQHAVDLIQAGVWVPDSFSSRNVQTSPRSTLSCDLLLRAENLAVARVKDQPIVHNLDFTVNAGSATAITGENGSGKSTFALALAGLMTPSSGKLVATDALAAGLLPEPIRWKSRQLVSRIGTVFQNPEHQFVAKTVREELAVAPRVIKLPAAETNNRIEEILQRLNLDSLAAANPFTLSGGQKRRLSVATVLVARPQIIVLDEPTFGQDFRTWQELVSLLVEQVKAGTALVAVSHDLPFVRALADQQFHLADGTGRFTRSAFADSSTA